MLYASVLGFQAALSSLRNGAKQPTIHMSCLEVPAHRGSWEQCHNLPTELHKPWSQMTSYHLHSVAAALHVLL